MAGFDREKEKVIALIYNRVHRDKFKSQRQRFSRSTAAIDEQCQELAMKHLNDMGEGAALLTFMYSCFDTAIPDRSLCHHILRSIADCPLPKKKTAAKYFTEITEKYAENCRAILAMHVTPLVEPDVKPPEPGSGDRYTYGYSFNAHSDYPKIYRAASDSCAHWTGSDVNTPYPVPEHRFRANQSWSQNALWLYSTAELAMQACRAAVSWKYAFALSAIDKRLNEQLKEAGGAS